jgi:cytochrome c biogenesis protein CcdA
MNERFPILSVVSFFLRIAGWGAVIGGSAYAIITFIGTDFDGWLPVIGGIAFSLWGLVIVALGESIGVLFAIEENTRRIS